MNDLLDPFIDATAKGFPAGSAPLRRSQIGAQGWDLLAGDLPLPLAVVRQEQLRHNLGWMQGYAGGAGVELAPHGKTTMSRQLFRQQLQQGAWGLTFANVAQARVGIAAGARNILIANQVLQACDLHAIARLREEHAGLRVLFLLDSQAQLQLVESVQQRQPFEVLLEVGIAGGRTGLRSHDEAMALARLVNNSSNVRLAGIECYEGLAATGAPAADEAYAQALMSRVQQLAVACDMENLFAFPEVIVSAGGSAIFDLVVPALLPRLGRKVRGVLRSGCYVTHDHGFYRRLVSAVDRRLGCAPGEGLQPALEVWAAVQSLPEPGLAILTAGKRDASYDMGMPVPLRFSPCGTRDLVRAPADWTVSAMNDQHAYLRLGDAPSPLKVGDRVALGISHPCTTFDKWRWMAVVDADWRVVDAITTCF